MLHFVSALINVTPFHWAQMFLKANQSQAIAIVWFSLWLGLDLWSTQTRSNSLTRSQWETQNNTYSTIAIRTNMIVLWFCLVSFSIVKSYQRNVKKWTKNWPLKAGLRPLKVETHASSLHLIQVQHLRGSLAIGALVNFKLYRNFIFGIFKGLTYIAY